MYRKFNPQLELSRLRFTFTESVPQFENQPYVISIELLVDDLKIKGINHRVSKVLKKMK